MKWRFLVCISLLIVVGLISGSLAGKRCLKITGARFEKVHFDESNRMSGGYDLVLAIKVKDLYPGFCHPTIYIDGEKVERRDWRYRYHYKSVSATSLFSTRYVDYETIWIKEIIPNANPQDHVIEITCGTACSSNRFHAAF
jgi:hypothetical protein